VSLDEYIFQTDKHNVKGLWEWEVPSPFHETCVGAIMKNLCASILPVECTNSDLILYGSTSEYFVGFYATVF